MARLRRTQTNFTGGAIDRAALGRADLRTYQNGLARARNVTISPLGGARRRDGTRYAWTAPAPGRLIAFEFNAEQQYLLVLTDQLATIAEDGVVIATLATPWTETQARQVAWTQSADTLLVVHPDVPPKKILRTLSGWVVEDWVWSNPALPFDRPAQPHGVFASGIEITPSATSGNVTLTTSAPYFDAAHVGVRLRIRDKELAILSVSSSTSAEAHVKEVLVNTDPTEDWVEQAFSHLRGYPVTVTFHQDRLVIGGSRDLPNQLWMSQSGEYFNFELGEGLDDEAIDVSVVSDQINAIRAVVSDRDLKVMTAGSEWRVAGVPVTPGNIAVERQTRVGSPTDRMVPPVEVDGATVFVAAALNRPHEIAYSDLDQAYLPTDLAVISASLFARPVRLAYDRDDRLLYVVEAAGTIRVLTIYKAEQVAAWAEWETNGAVADAATVGNDVFLLVERNGAHMVEVVDDTRDLDSSVRIENAVPSTVWSGLGHLEGLTVSVVADGAVHPPVVVEGGQIVLGEPATVVEVGLPFTCEIEPLPVQVLADRDDAAGIRTRPVAIRMRLLDTQVLYVDLGRGPVNRPLRHHGAALLDQPPAVFSGEVTWRRLGWRPAADTWAWRIEQSDPLPFHVLQVTTEIAYND